MYNIFILFLLPSSQRRPTQAHEGPQQPTTANKGQRRSTKAHSSQRRSMKAHRSQWRPTKANAGPRRQNGPKRRQTRRLGPRCVFFSFFFYNSYYYETAPTPPLACKYEPGVGLLTTTTTITRARDASRALFLSFYSPPSPSPSLGPETRLGPSVSFYFFYFILYFNGYMFEFYLDIPIM